jgi:catechol 2,3-dioxygenase-like lactoylglutathione lyase family enzyme
MNISGAATVFQVKNIESAVSFYCDVLGFDMDFRFGNYAGVHMGECCLHLCAHHVWERPCGSGAVSVFCDAVDAYCAEVGARGAQIRLEPTDEEYGMRDFVVRDPDGNVLTFGCSLPEGVQRPKI